MRRGLLILITIKWVAMEIGYDPVAGAPVSHSVWREGERERERERGITHTHTQIIIDNTSIIMMQTNIHVIEMAKFIRIASSLSCHTPFLRWSSPCF